MQWCGQDAVTTQERGKEATLIHKIFLIHHYLYVQFFKRKSKSEVATSQDS